MDKTRSVLRDSCEEEFREAWKERRAHTLAIVAAHLFCSGVSEPTFDSAINQASALLDDAMALVDREEWER